MNTALKLTTPALIQTNLTVKVNIVLFFLKQTVTREAEEGDGHKLSRTVKLSVVRHRYKK